MGLAIVAGALGLAFANIDRISKFKGAGFEAEMNMVHTLIENQTEPTEEQKAEASNRKDISEIEWRILKSLQHPNFSWRYANTIGDEVSLHNEEIKSKLSSLMKRDLVRSGKGKYGVIWTITSLGKDVQRQYENEKA